MRKFNCQHIMCSPPRENTHQQSSKMPHIGIFISASSTFALTHLGQRDGQTANAASAVADRLSLDVAIGLDPVQNLLDGLIVTIANVQLDGVDLVGIGVDLVPAAEALGVEVFPNLGLVVHGRGHGESRRSRGGAGSDKGGSAVGRGGNNGEDSSS